jgi:hypothetical protein
VIRHAGYFTRSNYYWKEAMDAHHHLRGQPLNVRFGSKADIGLAPFDVRFTPESGHGPAGRGKWSPSPRAAKRYALRLLSKKSSFLSECRAVVIDLLSIDDDELELITGDRTLA